MVVDVNASADMANTLRGDDTACDRPGSVAGRRPSRIHYHPGLAGPPLACSAPCRWGDVIAPRLSLGPFESVRMRAIHCLALSCCLMMGAATAQTNEEPTSGGTFNTPGYPAATPQRTPSTNQQTNQRGTTGAPDNTIG